MTRQAVPAVEAIEVKRTPPLGIVDPCGCEHAKAVHAAKPADYLETAETGPCLAMIETTQCACTAFMSWAERNDPSVPYEDDAYVPPGTHAYQPDPPSVHEIIQMVNERAAEAPVDGETAPTTSRRKVITTTERDAKEAIALAKYGPLRRIVSVVRETKGGKYVKLECGHEAGAGKAALKTRCRVCKAITEGREPGKRGAKKTKKINGSSDAVPKSRRRGVATIDDEIVAQSEDAIRASLAIAESVKAVVRSRKAVTDLPVESRSVQRRKAVQRAPVAKKIKKAKAARKAAPKRAVKVKRKGKGGR